MTKRAIFERGKRAGRMMKQRSRIHAFEVGQFSVAVAMFVSAISAPNRIIAAFYLGMLALVSLAFSVAYVILGWTA